MSPLDAPIAVTFFRNYAATTKTEELYTPRALAERIRAVTAASKDRLPWLKLARFGNLRTDKNSLRNDKNLEGITGIEGDYDGGRVTFDEALKRITQQGIAAILYTSPSHCEDAPRFRVLCPTSMELSPDQREHMLGRLNGLLGGISSGESFTLSQSYYYGSIKHNPSHRVELIDGTPIDLHDDLDTIWIGKPQTTPKSNGSAGPQSGPLDVAAVLRELMAGNNYHQSIVRLGGHYASDGKSFIETRKILRDAMESVLPPDRDQRWQTRYADVDRTLGYVFGKEASKPNGAAAGPEPPLPEDDNRARGQPHRAWPQPLDFFADTETATPKLQPEHLPTALWAFADDTSARMGVEPTSVAMSSLVSCASVISDEWCIQPKRYDTTWTEQARLWAAIVGLPSILKSPVIVACTKPIERLDAQARDKHQEEMRAYKIKLAAWKLAADKDAPEPRQPKLARYLVEGTTIEALSEALRDDDEAHQYAPAHKVLARHDEMAEFIANLDRYRTGGRGGGDRGAYLRLYNGGRYVVDRIGRGSFAIPNWSACLLGGIQPEPIQRIAKSCEDDGLLQRFMYCVPGGCPPGLDRKPDPHAVHRYAALFPILAALHPTRSVDGDPAAVVLHEQAHQHREDINALTRAMMALPDTSPRLQAALGKWPGLFARLCLTFHVIDIADARRMGATPPHMDVVPEETARRVADFMHEVLLPNLLRAEAVMFATVQTTHAQWIAGLILAHRMDRITTRDVVRAYGALRSPEARDELAAVMASLVAIGWLEPEAPRNPVKPVFAWSVNPAVHIAFEARAERERKRRDIARDQLTADIEVLRRKRREPQK